MIRRQVYLAQGSPLPQYDTWGMSKLGYALYNAECGAVLTPPVVVIDDAGQDRYLAPWISALTGIVLLVFVIVLVATAISMALANDSRIYFGLPGSARPLFLLPLLAALLALVMLVSAAAAWLRRAGSVWGRLYLTLLSFAAIACVAMLGVLRLLTAFFRG